jgi:nucleoside-diphosphate-sugar epimerase
MSIKESATLVVGGTGFIGKALVERLQNDQKNILYTSRRNSLDPRCIPLSSISNWRNLVQDRNINEIYIVAGKYQSSDNPRFWGDLWEANYTFPKQILDQLWDLDLRILLVGSFLQKNPAAKELWSFYTWSKECLRHYINLKAAESRAQVTYVYLYDNFGPNDDRLKILNILMKLSESDQPLKCGSSEQDLDLTHISDVTAGLILANNLSRKENPCEFQIRGLKPISLKNLVKLVEEYRKMKIPVLFGENIDRRPIFNLWNCAKEIPGFNCQITLEEFLSGNFETVRKQMS